MINKNLLITNASINSREEALDLMFAKANEQGYISDVSEYSMQVYNREKIIPTSIGFNVAIPHGISEAVKQPFVVLLTNDHEIKWDDASDNLVDLVFLIGIPKENKDNLHLRFLAEISKKTNE